MNERSDRSLPGVVLDRSVTFTLTEFCEVCGTERALVVEMVQEGVIEPAGSEAGEWLFHGESLLRARAALRLVHDLHVNWPGAALALDLLEELERL